MDKGMLAIGVGAMAVGVGLLAWNWFSQMRADEARRWPLVAGQILETGVLEHRTIRENNPPLVSYEPTIRYAYEVQGTRLEGTRLAPGPTPHESSRTSAEERLEDYRPGAEVMVRVNPADPAEAFILEESRGAGAILAGLAFLAGGGLALARALRWL